MCTLHLQHKSCVKGKKSIFYPAFLVFVHEFPACAKLIGSTIMFFSVCSFFSLKDDLTSHIEDPLCKVFRSP